ncbi:MAG: secretion activator protein, partial [Pseudolabrys sp.]|nr:secretion activator protein [Pseudolabrys sp.]
WDACACDELPAGVDYAVFDYGVNSGIGRAKKVLQRVLGVAADGVLGDQTMRAVAACDPTATVIAICDERLRFLKRLRTWGVFGRGWGRRVSEVKAYSLALAGKPAAKRPKAGPAAQRIGKGVVPVAKGAQQGSAGAIVAAGAAAAQQAHGAGVGAGGVAAIAAAAIAAAIAAYAFWLWRQRRQQEVPA